MKATKQAGGVGHADAGAAGAVYELKAAQADARAKVEAVNRARKLAHAAGALKAAIDEKARAEALIAP